MTTPATPNEKLTLNKPVAAGFLAVALAIAGGAVAFASQGPKDHTAEYCAALDKHGRLIDGAFKSNGDTTGLAYTAFDDAADDVDTVYQQMKTDNADKSFSNTVWGLSQAYEGVAKVLKPGSTENPAFLDGRLTFVAQMLDDVGDYCG